MAAAWRRQMCRRRARPRAGHFGAERGRLPRSRPSSRSGFYTEGEFGASGSPGAPPTRSRRASRSARASATTSSGSSRCRPTCWARPIKPRATRPSSGQLLQAYQGTVEGKLTLRFVQRSFFAEGGLGAARMSSNLLYARGLARSTGPVSPTGEAAASTTTSCRATSRSAARRLLPAAATSPAARTCHHHVPEVHVLMRRWLRASRCGRRPRGLGCETVDLGHPPADINACRPSQQCFVDEIWPNFLAKDGYRAACTATMPPATARWRRTRWTSSCRCVAGTHPADRRLGRTT